MAFKPIEILINAKDNASSVFGNLQTKVAAVGAAIAGYFGIKAFAGAVSGAADLETAMSRVQAATGATADEMAQLRKAAQDASEGTKFTAIETAGALENLAKAGLNAGDSIAALPGVMALAQAGDISLAESSELLTKSISGMGDKFTDAARYADVLALGANATNTSVLGLAQALSYAAPVASSLGLSLESTVAIIGKFADAGIDASRAGTALNSILSQFSNPASKFRQELAAAGITTGNFETALHQLAAAGPAGSKAIIAVGQEAGPALRALLNQGMGALDELTAKLRQAEGSAAATAKVMKDNLNGSLGSLSTAWDSLKNALATPVLPVLKDGVDQLAGAFRAAVADGTIGKFGDAIATAFQAGIKWVREFVGSVDFDALKTRLQDMADRAGEAFTQLGEHAKTAGNTVQLAYGVMSGGANAVMTGIYGIAASYAEAAIRIVDFAARASDALAKISIGKAKEELKQQAEDMRGVLVGLAGVRDEFIKKTLASLDATATSAQHARDGFAGLAGGLGAVRNQGEKTSKAMAAVADELSRGAEAAAKAGAAYQKKISDELLAARAADEHRAAMAQLRAEYAELIRAGNLDGAARKLEEINKALAGTPPAAEAAAKAAAEAAAQIDAAFGRLGVASSAALKEQAVNAQRDYETIRKAGTGTAEDIAGAFRVAAEKAIAANKGIAPSWVTAEAAARGYKIVVDSAGKSHLDLIDKAVPGLDRLAKGWHASREAIEAQADAMAEMLMRYTMTADMTERQIALLDREAAAAEKAAEAYRKKWNMDKEGYALNSAGERALVGETQEQIDADIAKRYGAKNIGNADAMEARQLAKILSDMAQIGGLSRIQSRESSQQIAGQRRRLQELEARLLNGSGAGVEDETRSGAVAPTTRPPVGGTNTGGSRTGGGGGGVSAGSTIVHLHYAGVDHGPVPTTPEGQRSMQSFLNALSDGKRTAR